MLTCLPPTSRLSPQDVEWLRGFLRDRPLFRLYLEAAIADLTRGMDNRVAYVGQERAGAILGIHFDRLAVFTALGQLRDSELAAMLDVPLPVELHVEPSHEAALLPLCGSRLVKALDQRIYARAVAGARMDADVRRLDRADSRAIGAFMTTHYPRTVFSDWMLSLPFVVLEANGAIAAAGGTIAIQDDLALIGNFLTHPEHRGRGAARRLASHLVATLGQMGVRTVLLVTTGDNPAACRAYEAAGFEVVERRRQIDLAARDA